MIKETTVNAVIEKLIKKYPSEAARASACVRQAARLWNTRVDGTAAEFSRFCRDNFLIGPDLEKLLATFEAKLESAGGHFNALLLKLRREVDEDTGPLGPADRLFAAYSPGAHFIEDMFRARLAFLALLNFPVKTLETCLEQGPGWTREEWACARLAQRFAHRVPPEVNRELAAAYSEAEQYINSYNILLNKVTGPDGEELFPKGVRLISHWGLRDYLKGLYSDRDGLRRQRVLQKVMERIITQEIPLKAVNSDKHAWDPAANTLDGAKADREPDTRYEKFLDIFRAHLKEDPFYPEEPTHMDRKFKLGREIPEPEVEALFTSLLEAGEGAEAAALIAARLGRPLEPFDIWYDGFKARSGVTQADLDEAVAGKYPDVAAFQRDIPEILKKLGFSQETARFVADRVEVNAARGAGHAWGAGMRTEKARLRTRVPAGGMDYQGFNVAMHELGHCTEQVFSLYRVDHTLLSGVPNTAFTEGFAFVFQDRDLDVLGLAKPNPAALHSKNLDAFWSAREIAGVALVDMNVWRWLYKNKDAEAADLRQAVVEIAKSVWDRHYAPLFGAKGSPLLAVYSHMINHALYLPDYPLGHIIAFQVEEYFKDHPLAGEMERMCVQGSVTPREWMRRAVGADISAEPMLKAAARALKALAAARQETRP
ncbi:MAG: hypothetical protein NDI60_08510 [Elusimicrobiales bacterium]|nr:hypothetical protein [Elusimicrobiales bacterium]